jgi:hypothetical protein
VLLSSGDSFPHLIQKRRSQLGFVTYLLNCPCITGTLAHLPVECRTCKVNIIAVCLCLDADTSINLLFLCIACLNCFDTVNCLMEALYLQFIKKNPTRYNSVLNFIIPYLYEAQHVSGDTPPIIRSLKLHWQPLVFHTWKVVCVVGGHCQAQYVLTFQVAYATHTLPDNVQELHV